MIPAFDESSASPWSLNNVTNTQYTTFDQCYASADPAVSDEWLSFSSPQAGSSSSSIAPSPSSSAPGDDSTTSSSPNDISTSRQRRLQCLDPSCTRKFANEYTRKVSNSHHTFYILLLPSQEDADLDYCSTRCIWALIYPSGGMFAAKVVPRSFLVFMIVCDMKRENTISLRSGSASRVCALSPRKSR